MDYKPTSSFAKQLKTAVSVLGQLFPLYLTLIVFVPVFIGFIIDFDLSNTREIIINLIWIPIFTIPYYFFQKRFIYHFAVVFYFIIGIIQLAHWIALKGPVTITSLFVIANTNFTESLDFIDLKVSAWLLLLIPYAILFVYSLFKPPKVKKNKFSVYYVVVILLISGIFIFENALSGRLIRKGVPQFVKMTLSFVEKRALFFEAMKENQARNINAHLTNSSSGQTFVLIIGESCSRNHMSLYGYSRKTNPLLENRSDIVAYDNLVSAYSNTIDAILSMITQSNLENGLAYENSIDLIDHFYSCGFKTFWISNQSPIGVWDNMVTSYANKFDVSEFMNTTSNSSFEAIQNSSYDSKLFQPLASALNDTANRKFIVLHLMGSHSSYAKRYPSEFELFEGNGSREQTIAEFDNSILYNDFFVDSCFKMIGSYSRANNESTVSAIYVSDHGENVFDELDRVGHDYANDLPPSNVEIPFVVWLSESYIQQNPEKSQLIKSNYGKPFVSDDIFNAILDLNGIESPVFKKGGSVFNKDFDASRKRVLEDGNDYDEKKKTAKQ